MNQKELTETFMMVSKWKKHLVSIDFSKKNSQLIQHYYNNNIREILELANLSSLRNLRKLKPREYYQIYSIWGGGSLSF